MALKIGDEKTQFNKTFVYIGGGKWQLKPSATSTVTAQEDILTELDKKSDLTETQPVSVATLPLPTGAATAVKQLPDNHQVTVSNQISTTGLATTAKQDTLLTELQLKADLTETQPVSLATLPTLIDPATNSIVTIDYPHYKLHSGNHYFYTDSVELASAATQVYLFTTPDTTTFCHMTYIASGSAITQIQLYEGADRTGTTLQTVFNNNRNSLNTASTTVHKDISDGTTDGTLIAQLKSGSATAQSRSGATAERENEIILKRNTKYLLRFTSGTNANLCNLQLAWYEHVRLDV